jgi:hypothetical protein
LTKPPLSSVATKSVIEGLSLAEGRFPVKSVAEAIGVSRSNLAERPQKRIGRPNRG